MKPRDYEQLTFCPRESPASLPATPGSAEAQRMTAGSGEKLYESYERQTQHGPCLRMLTGLLLYRTAWRSNQSYLTWKPRVTKHNRLLFRLVVSAPRTGGTGSPFLPTVTATVGTHGGPNQRDSSGRPGLQMAAMMWQTPSAEDAGRNGSAEGWMDYQDHGRTTQCRLRNQVQMWPTPVVPNGGRSVASVTDWRSPRTAYKNGKKVQVDLNAAVRMWPTPRANGATGQCKHGDGGPDLQSAVMGGAPVGAPTQTGKTKGAQLSAAWVTRLMGLPDGWLDL